MGSTASLDRSPRQNWVEKAGRLPPAIRDMAAEIEKERGLPLDQAIPIAISQAKKLAAKGNAKYVAAVAEWEALKAKAHVKEAVTKPLGALGMVLAAEQVGDLGSERLIVQEASGVTVNGMQPGRTAGQQLAARGKKPAAGAKTRDGQNAEFEREHPRGRGGDWILKAGSKGGDVRAIQRRVGGLKVDGEYGPKTAAAIRAFQKRHGLVVDGKVGHQTTTALAGHYAAARKAKPGAIKRSDRAKLANLRGRRDVREASPNEKDPTTAERQQLRARCAKAAGVSLKRDKNGLFVHTHRARSKSYASVAAIPLSVIEFIESTG